MLRTVNLGRDYYVKNKNGSKTKVEAVKNVCLKLNENNSYSLVGESGSGKSTLAKLIMSLEKPTTGEIYLENKNIASIKKRKLRTLRSDFQMVLQDSYSALNPKMKIYDSIAEPIRNFEKLTLKQEKETIESLITKVELPVSSLKKYPHQLSGGQQKRVCIARAIATNPKFIVFDEAVSGLDVTVRKKILDLLLKLRSDINSTYLFITHDIDVAFYMADNIAVMKDGEIVEYVKNIKSLNDFKHDYSRMLIDSLPPLYPKQRDYLKAI